MPVLDEPRLRALLSSQVKDADGQILAVQVDDGYVWPGAEQLQGLARPTRVAVCRSPLEVRAAVAEHDDPAEALVILTPCTGERDLGLDLLARLVKRRVLPVDRVPTLLSLFGADAIDPALAAQEWLVDDLLQAAPIGGWLGDRPANRVLDLDRAWAVWHRVALGDVAEPRSLVALLALATQPGVAARLHNLSGVQRTALSQRWLHGVAPVAVIVDEIAAQRHTDVVALGLIAGLLVAPTDDSALARLQTRTSGKLDNQLGHDRLTPDGARRWAEAASELLDAASDDLAAAQVARADSLLEGLNAGDLSVLSDQLPSGFDRRLLRVGEALTARDLPSAEHRYEELAAHRGASRHLVRTRTAEAAVRLLRRTVNRSTVPATPAAFSDAVERYVQDGAWVDHARGLLADGDHLSSVGSAYQQLCADVDAERRTEAEDFGSLLAEWSKAEAPPEAGLLPVERVLADAVAVAAKDAPVLLVVMDGMGLPVGNTVVRDIVTSGWRRVRPESSPDCPAGIAMLPTVTDLSRTSLLTGVRQWGQQAEERKGFATHPALTAVSPVSRPPLLFHKATLDGPNGVSLAADVHAAIGDVAQRVVGVVVNAVDDHLSKGQQLRMDWDLQALRPLVPLLDTARAAGRMLVLTADHGHVLHRTDGRKLTTGGDAGDRWRVAPPPAADGELQFVGPRVMPSSGPGPAVLLVDERGRYAVVHHGYHGGASPQEVLVPVEVFAPREPPKGWIDVPPARPSWWDAKGDLAMVPVVPPVLLASSTPPSLFDPIPPTDGAELSVPEVPADDRWIAALFESPTFQAQLQTPAGRRLSEARVRRYLSLLVNVGGSMALTRLAERVGEPPDQTQMALSQVRRLVNMDGTEVLSVKGNETVELNVPLLALQFEVDAS